jgi:RNA polymerase sigma-70 factor (ECF subfamily)
MPSPDEEPTVRLIERFRSGDSDALDILLARHLPRLRRWAAGRLPATARDGVDTQDLVQETLVRTLRLIGAFECRRDGALQAYLRQALMNSIRDCIRSTRRRPIGEPLRDDSKPAGGDSPLELAIGRECAERYEAALNELEAPDREAIVGRIELGYDYDELATALEKPSPGAARIAVRRALLKLATKMNDLSDTR